MASSHYTGSADIWELRARDRKAHGGIVVPAGESTSNPGRYWECDIIADRHAPLCDCQGWQDGIANPATGLRSLNPRSYKAPVDDEDDDSPEA